MVPTVPYHTFRMIAGLIAGAIILAAAMVAARRQKRRRGQQAARGGAVYLAHHQSLDRSLAERHHRLHLGGGGRGRRHLRQ